MIVLTWIAFAIAAVCLHKLLWKPILKVVEKREKDVDEALQGAANARQELSEAEAGKRKIIHQTEQDVRTMTEAATRTAAAIVARADTDARAAEQRRVAEAERVIQGEYRKAFEELRHNAADNIARTVEKLIRQHLTDEQKRAYHEEMLKEIKL
jgi:F-type H+-transporting ATPase subunit b